jgi:hypothetical protein
VIEVKLICRTADYTFSTVSPPNRKLHTRGYHSATLNVFLWTREILVFLNGNEFVLENLAVFVAFLPGIDEMKDAVVRPDSCLDFLVYSHALWSAHPRLIQLGNLVEFTILCEPTGRKPFRLINNFGIRGLRPSRLIVPFVNKSGATIL